MNPPNSPQITNDIPSNAESISVVSNAPVKITALSPPSSSEITTGNNRPFIIQNGNVYQLAGNSHQIVSNKSSTTITTTCINNSNVVAPVALNSLQSQMNNGNNINLAQRIKMTTVKPNGAFNLNLNTSKSMQKFLKF